MLKSRRCSITQRCPALGRIKLTSLVSTSRYWVWSPMSGIYATMESARVCCHATRTNGPLSGTGYVVAVTHTNGPPVRNSRDHTQCSGRLRTVTPEKIYHSKKNNHNTQETNHTITRAIYVVRQRCLRPRGGGKFHYESKDYYKMIEERITSHRWWQVEPFKSRTLDLVAVTSNIDRLLRLPLAATNHTVYETLATLL